MKSYKGVFFVLILLSLVVACTPPFFEPLVQEEEIQNPGWENVGILNASFISTSRSIGVSTNTSSPSFDVSFIASASNIDSLVWSFPGGKTNDSINEIGETVNYDAYGRYDVGLKVFNLENTDSRYFENFIDLYYKDNLLFDGPDASSWTVSGTAAGTTVFTHPVDQSGLAYENWAMVSYDIEQMVEARKNFDNFPTNELVLEFDYKLDRLPVIFIDNSSLSGTSLSSPASAEYVSPANTGVITNTTRVESPAIYPGEKRFSIEYNDITIWSATRINEEYYEHVRLDLPSLSSFSIALLREPQEMITRLIPFVPDATPNDVFTQGTATVSTTLDPFGDEDSDGVSNMDDAFPLNSSEQYDTDRDGYGDNEDTDNDNDGYLDATEAANGSDPLDATSIPKYVIQHVRYPYNLNIRNMTIKIKED